MARYIVDAENTDIWMP